MFLYDVENRLVEKRDQGTGNTNCASLSYAGSLKAKLNYDPLGRLVAVTGDQSGTTKFLYDGNALIAEYDSNGALRRRYVHGSNAEADDPLIWYEGSTLSNRRYVHADTRGSIVAVTDLTGALITTNTYDEYGIPDVDSMPDPQGDGITTKGRFRYTGQVWLPELEMYYYKARIYSPKLGRFLQTDPIGYEDQFNLYAYVGNDPVNAVDFLGLDTLPLCPGNDPACTREAEVTAPLSSTEQSRHDHLLGEFRGGSLGEIIGDAVSNRVKDLFQKSLLAEGLNNAATSNAIGAQGELTVARTLTENGYVVVASGVTIETAAGFRVADHVVRDVSGKLFLLEVKANSAVRSFNQARKDHIIQKFGGILRSRKPALEDQYGKRIEAETLIVNIRVPKL